MNSYTLADISPGLTADFTLEVTAEKMALFYELTGDCSPIHMDEAYAQRRGYPGRVVYGMLGASLFSTLAGVYLPGEHCLLHGVECKFARPVFIGDVLTVSGHCDGGERDVPRDHRQGRHHQPERAEGDARSHPRGRGRLSPRPAFCLVFPGAWGAAGNAC